MLIITAEEMNTMFIFLYGFNYLLHNSFITCKYNQQYTILLELINRRILYFLNTFPKLTMLGIDNNRIAYK